MRYAYPLLFLAEFVLLIAMTYIIAELDGTPEILARIGLGLCIMAAGLTSWKASQGRRKARAEKAQNGQPRSGPGSEQ